MNRNYTILVSQVSCTFTSSSLAMFCYIIQYLFSIISNRLLPKQLLLVNYKFNPLAMNCHTLVTRLKKNEIAVCIEQRLSIYNLWKKLLYLLQEVSYCYYFCNKLVIPQPRDRIDWSFLFRLFSCIMSTNLPLVPSFSHHLTFLLIRLFKYHLLIH